MARYALGLLPLPSSFPVATLVINLLGATFIGILAALIERGGLTDPAALFWKVGVCGGFTTFSTFSLETLTLLQSGRLLPACLYIALSVVLCLLGVAAGQCLGHALCSAP